MTSKNERDGIVLEVRLTQLKRFALFENLDHGMVSDMFLASRIVWCRCFAHTSPHPLQGKLSSLSIGLSR